MAITGTHIETDISDANASLYTTGTRSPTANRLQLLATIVADTNPVLAPTVTGCGLTWVQVAHVEFDTAGTRRAITLFRALGGAPTTGALTITPTEAVSGCGWTWTEYDGIDTGGTNGSAAVVQSVTNSGSGTALSATLAAFGSASNGAAVVMASDADSVFTAGTGWSVLGQDVSASASPTQSIGTEWRADNDTSPDSTMSPTGLWGMIAVELKVAAAGYTPPLGLSYRVAFAFGVAPGTVPTSGQWTYFDNKVKSIEVVRGRNRETEDVQPSRCRIKLDDPLRNLEPDFSGSTYYPNVVPMTPVKVEAWYRTSGGSTMYPRFTGYVDDFVPLWNREAEVVVPCSDAASLLQATTLRHPYVAAVLNTSPGVYWRFSETAVTQPAADATGGGHTGQYQGTPTFSQPDPITDTIDGAILFGTGSWVGGPAGSTSLSSMSMAVWFRHATVTSTDVVYLTAWTTTEGYGEQITMGGTTTAYPGKIGVFTAGGGFTTTARYDDDAWHFLVFTGDGTDGHLYIDGTDVSGAFSAVGPYLAGQITVGGWPLSGDVYSFGGSVDEPAFWSNRVLTAAEVTAMYAARDAWLGQTPKARVQAVLTAAGWGWGQVLDTGLVTLQSAGDLEGKTAWAHILEVTGRGGESGLFYIDTQGRAVLHDGQWPLRNATVQGTYGDSSGELRFESVEPESSNSTIRNEWRGQRVGGPLIISSDATSITRYLRRSEPSGGGAISFVVQSDATVLSLLQWWLAHYKDPLFTVRKMTVRQASDAMVQTSLGLDLQQRISVNRRPNGGTLHGADHLVQGYRESWGRDTQARWQMDFTLSPAEAQTYGGWGVGVWGSTFRWAY
jgi:hypothetical protein